MSGLPPSAPLDISTLTALITASITAALQPLQAEIAEVRAGGGPSPPPPTVVPTAHLPSLAASRAPFSPSLPSSSAVALSSSSARPFWNPLPPELVPAAAGSPQDNAQLLVRLITTFHRRSSRYPTLRAFREALDNWMNASARSGWSGPQLNSLMNYTRFVSIDLAQWPLSTIMDYHTRWIKGVHEGTIDMFAQDAHLNLACLHHAGLLLASPPTGTRTSHPPDSDEDNDDAEHSGSDSSNTEDADL
jgi:hypothetical protein